MTTEAENRWHDELDAALAEASDGEPGSHQRRQGIAPTEGSCEAAPPRPPAFEVLTEEHGAASAAERASH